MYVRKIYGMEHFFRYICLKDLHNRMHDGMLLANWKLCQKRIYLSDRLKSTESLDFSPSFWTRHFKRSVKPRQSWLTRTTDGNIKVGNVEEGDCCKPTLLAGYCAGISLTNYHPQANPKATQFSVLKL